MGITVATTRVACNTATGNQNITTADLGGLTPKAVFFTITRCTADGTPIANAIIGLGAATSSSNRWAMAVSDRDAQANTANFRRGMTDECVLALFVGGGIDGEADFVQFIADGCTINWGNACASAYLLTATFFAGTDLTALADVFTAAAAQDATVDVNTVGFEPDILLTSTFGYVFTDVAAITFYFSHGLVLNKTPVEQYCYAYRNPSGAAVSAISGQITDDYGIGQVGATGTFTWWAGEFSAFDANGFSCTTRNGASGSDEVGFLALKLGGAVGFEGNIITSPVANGNQAIADPGFTPQYVHVGLTQFIAIDTGYSDGTAGSLGVSDFDDDDEYCNSVQIEDAQSTTDTQSLSDNTVINLPDDDATVGWVASFISFDANGWTWNFTQSHGTAVKWWYLAIEEEAAGLSIPVAMHHYRMLRAPGATGG